MPPWTRHRDRTKNVDEPGLNDVCKFSLLAGADYPLAGIVPKLHLFHPEVSGARRSDEMDNCKGVLIRV